MTRWVQLKAATVGANREWYKRLARMTILEGDRANRKVGYGEMIVSQPISSG